MFAAISSATAVVIKAILKITNRNFRIKRTFLLYRLLLIVGFPFIIVYLAVRLLRRDYWSHIGERFGFLPQMFSRTEPGCIWLHAVSVGEVASAVSLLEELHRERPRTALYLSVGTVAGRRTAERLVAGLVSDIFYAPIDYVSCIRRTIRTIRPASLIILETEIWPNLLNEVKQTGAAVIIASARISDRSWPRYSRSRALFGPVLNIPDLVIAQSEADRARFAEIGVPADRLRVAGNLKYDFIPPAAVRFTLPISDAHPIWIAASTVGPNERGSIESHQIDEDAIVIDSFQKLKTQFPNLLLILAPRQPARFETVARLLQAANVSFVRRTELQADTSRRFTLPGVLLLDTVGELAGLYSQADLAFVGGSIAPRGGHNILEPASAGVPVIVGPHMENFGAVVRDFVEASAIVRVDTAEQLTHVVSALLHDSSRRGELAARARQVVERQRGVSRRIAATLWPLHDRSFIRPPSAFVTELVLGPLAALWGHAGRHRRVRGEALAASRPPLPVPVISIGGITMGGAGKTPVCEYLARCLRQQGYTPAILTRGYGRRCPACAVVARPGSRIPTAFTGDEAQIFLRAGQASLAVGADRYIAAEQLLQHLPETDVLLLDDGFQHAPLRRDLDLVVIDGLDPFGGDAVFPVGRLREPLEALRRADAFVITRAEEDSRFNAIRGRLRDWCPTAPIYRGRLVPRCWRNSRGAKISIAPEAPIAAFCGLGNPQNFWNTLKALGLDVAFRWSFGDHHQYQPIEISRLAHQARVNGARVLVTTEKDAINMPANAECLLGDLQLAWLEIEVVIENEDNFFSELRSRLAPRAVGVAG